MPTCLRCCRAIISPYYAIADYYAIISPPTIFFAMLPHAAYASAVYAAISLCCCASLRYH